MAQQRRWTIGVLLEVRQVAPGLACDLCLSNDSFVMFRPVKIPSKRRVEHGDPLGPDPFQKDELTLKPSTAHCTTGPFAALTRPHRPAPNAFNKGLDDRSLPAEPHQCILAKPLLPSVGHSRAPTGWTVRHDKNFAFGRSWAAPRAS